jgi:hypothetical protein
MDGDRGKKEIKERRYERNDSQSNFSGPLPTVLHNLENDDAHCTLLQLYVKMLYCDGNQNEG